MGSQEMPSDSLSDRQPLAFLHVAVADVRVLRMQTVAIIAEANRLRRTIEKLESPLERFTA
jgi:hypothetical protein